QPDQHEGVQAQFLQCRRPGRVHGAAGDGVDAGAHVRLQPGGAVGAGGGGEGLRGEPVRVAGCPRAAGQVAEEGAGADQVGGQRQEFAVQGEGGQLAPGGAQHAGEQLAALLRGEGEEAGPAGLGGAGGGRGGHADAAPGAPVQAEGGAAGAGQVVGPGVEEGVGGGVRRLAGGAEESGGGGEQHEAVRFGGELGEQGGAEDLGRQDAQDACVGQVGHGGVVEDAGGVDDGGDRAGVAAQGVQGGGEGGAVGDVGPGEVHGDAVVPQSGDPGRGVRVGGAAAQQGEAAGAAADQLFGDDPAEAAQSASDEVDPVRGDAVAAVAVAGAVHAGHLASRAQQGHEALAVGVRERGPQGVGAVRLRQVDQGGRQFRVLLVEGEAEAPGEGLLRVGDPGAVTGRLAAAHDDEEARGRAASGQGPDQVEGGQAAQPRRLLGGAVVGDGGGVQGGELDDAGGRGVGERLVQQPGQLVGVG